MTTRSRNLALTFGLVFAVFLWGANNTGTKLVVKSWPPIWTGGSRFFCAGLVLFGILRFSTLLGSLTPLTPKINRDLWWRGGASLAIYIVVFNTALQLTSVAHVALYLGASPVWALLWERQRLNQPGALRKYVAAAVALLGVFLLFLPALREAHSDWRGEVLGLAASVLWTNYGRQCRLVATRLSGSEVSAHTMWRAGLLLLPLGMVEVWHYGIQFKTEVILAQSYCILGGGVVAFAIWSTALRYWPTSQVLLFNNLIPLSSMSWAHYWLAEPITPTFWIAMVLVMAGVLLGQINGWPGLPLRKSLAG
jgi:drug/metabolite transporter (DMT)-like permease